MLYRDVFYGMITGEASQKGNEASEESNEDDVETTDEVYDVDVDDEIIKTKDEPNEINTVSDTMNDSELSKNITKMLEILVGTDTLKSFGWPNESIELVLSLLIKQCGQLPNDSDSCDDFGTIMRENTKLLFSSVLDDDSLKTMLNNHTVDEVILHVIKSNE